MAALTTGESAANVARTMGTISNEFENRRVIIFGATGGIGSAVERCLAGVSEKHSRADGLVNCAGSLLLKPAHLTIDAEWAAVLGGQPVFCLPHSAIRHVVDDKDGRRLDCVAVLRGLPARHDQPRSHRRCQSRRRGLGAVRSGHRCVLQHPIQGKNTDRAVVGLLKQNAQPRGVSQADMELPEEQPSVLHELVLLRHRLPQGIRETLGDFCRGFHFDPIALTLLNLQTPNEEFL